MTSKFILAVALTATLAACGTRPEERAVSGGLIGAGVGGLGAAVVGANPIAGAAIGAGAGAITGAVTDPDAINLDHR